MSEFQLKYVPFSNRIIGKIKKVGEVKSPSGLILQTQEQSRFTKVEILAVGRGYLQQDGKIVPLEVQVGDMVYLSAGVGYPMPEYDHAGLSEGDVIIVFCDNDIICKVN